MDALPLVLSIASAVIAGAALYISVRREDLSDADFEARPREGVAGDFVVWYNGNRSLYSFEIDGNFFRDRIHTSERANNARAGEEIRVTLSADSSGQYPKRVRVQYRRYAFSPLRFKITDIKDIPNRSGALSS